MSVMMIVTMYQEFFVCLPDTMLNIVVKSSKQNVGINILSVLQIKKFQEVSYRFNIMLVELLTQVLKNILWTWLSGICVHVQLPFVS